MWNLAWKLAAEQTELINGMLLLAAKKMEDIHIFHLKWQELVAK